MGALSQDGLADETVGRNITLNLTLTSFKAVTSQSLAAGMGPEELLVPMFQSD
jgi:hypothetical protein